MFWSKGNSVLRWDASKSIVVSEKNAPLDRAAAEKCKNMAQIFKNLHAPQNKEVDGALILHSCQKYAEALSPDPVGYMAFKLAESCILTPKDGDSKKNFASAFKFQTENIIASETAKIAQMLVCCSHVGFAQAYVDAGGSKQARDLLLSVYEVSHVGSWRNTMLEFMNRDNSTQFDKKFITFITGEQVKLGNVMADIAAKLCFSVDSLKRAEISSFVAPFINSVQEGSIESLLKAFVDFDISKVTRTCFEITNSEMITAHLVDLIFTATEYKRSPIINALADERSLALRRYAEFLLPEQSLANEVYTYIRFLNNGKKIIEPLMPLLSPRLSYANMATISDYERFTCEFLPQSSLITEIRKSIEEGPKAISKALMQSFCSLSRRDRSSLMIELANIPMDELSLTNEVIVAMLDSTSDTRIHESLTQKLFTGIEATGSVPLYQ